MSLEQNPEHHHRTLVDKYVDPVVSYQMKTFDYVVRVSAAAPITITLPPVAEAMGRFYSIIARVATPTNTVTIASADSSSWPGNPVVNTNGTKLLFYSDGLTWHQLSDSFSSTQFLAGAPIASKATAVETFDGTTHQTVITLTLTGANDLDLSGAADNGIGVQVYQFPAGRINILGSVIDATVVTNLVYNASANDVFNVGAGSVSATQAAEGDLTATEVDLLPKVVLDTVSNTVATFQWESALAAGAQFDGTATALKAFINAAVLNASTTADVTLAITGTWTITWVNLGDIA